MTAPLTLMQELLRTAVNYGYEMASEGSDPENVKLKEAEMETARHRVEHQIKLAAHALNNMGQAITEGRELEDVEPWQDIERLRKKALEHLVVAIGNPPEVKEQPQVHLYIMCPGDSDVGIQGSTAEVLIAWDPKDVCGDRDMQAQIRMPLQEAFSTIFDDAATQVRFDFEMGGP